MVCKGFLERCPADVQTSLAALLPPSLQIALEELSAANITEPAKSDLLAQIHPTWLAPLLRTLSEQEIRFCLSGINGNQGKALKTLLGFSNGLATLKPLARTFIRSFLLGQLTAGTDLLPAEAIPDVPLKSLLDLGPKQLHELILFLGLHDLSIEMHQIIETAKLKKIYSSLPEPQADYLKNLTSQREPLIFKRLFLEEWNGEKETLQKLLEERGLARLGAALWQSDAQLIWHLTHRMDLNLATRLLKACVEPSQPRAQKILHDQINQIQAFIGPS